jgi:actin-related protein 6
MDLSGQSIVNVTNERFLVPEVLFSPSDIGINQGGIADTIKQVSKSRIPSAFEHLMFSNIVIGGGNTRIPGFKARLQYELDENGYLPDQVKTAVITDVEDDQCLAAWKGLKMFAAQTSVLDTYKMTKRDYQEQGPRIL